MKIFRPRLEHVLFCLSIVILVFSNDLRYAVTFQIVGVSLICAAGAVCLFRGRTYPVPPTVLDALFLTIIAFSGLASIISLDQYVAQYTIVFALAYLSIMVMVRALSEEEIAGTILVSIAMVIAVVATTHLGALLETLRPGAPNRWEMRLSPFDMHPNLSGYVYGGFIVIVLFADLKIRFAPYLKAAMIALCVMVILAASARAGLLALTATVLVYAIKTVLQGGKQARFLLLGAFALVIGSSIYYESILQYLSEMLELNSDTRGVDSGGSGRFGLWLRGVSLIGSRTWQVLIGGGLRSATEGILGFHTENSYITIVIESGVLVPICLFGYLLYLIYRMMNIEARQGRHFDRMVLYCTIFAMLQSIFNRYLIAIGNPFSLIFLILLARIDLKYAIEARQFRRSGMAAGGRIAAH